jgi:CRP-like cAMP-binding protein
VHMKHQKHIEISPEQVEEIQNHFSSKKFKSQSYLFYEGQIPISGYLIVDGTVQISTKNKFKKILTNGSIIGVRELLKKEPIMMSAEVFPNTELCFLDKSTMQEILDNEDQELSKVLKDIFEIRHD